MKNMKLVIAFVLVALIGAGVAGGAVWWLHLQKLPAAGVAGLAEAKVYKYLALDKVIVMLRRKPGDSVSHYLSADLIISTTAEQEKLAKEHLPMLRSIAVKALSGFPLSQAETMTVDQFATEINRAFVDNYAKNGEQQPFVKVMLGKLIIE